MLRSRLTGLATAAAVIGGMLIGAPVVHAEGPDTTPPTVTIISPVENQQVPIGVQPLPTVQYTCDDDVAVQTCDASIGRVNGSNPWITVGNTMPLDLVLPGQYILRVTSTDTAGNPAESSVQFEMVGEGPRDETAPSIQITAPVDGAPVTKGANLTATYLCQDSGSGIESCDGPVASGAAVDTSTLGRKDFTVVARDKAGNESMQTVQYEVIAPTNVTVAGTIKDIEGNVLPGSTVRALMTGTSTVVASTEANANGVYSLTLPAGTYDLRYRSHSGTLLGADLAERTYLQDKTVNVVLGPIDPDPVVLSGTITTGSGSPLQYAYIALGNASTSTDAQGRYSLQVQPGSYSMQAQSNGVRLQKSVSIGGDGSTLNLQFPQQSVSVLVHVVDADGQPVTGPPMVPGADRQKSFLSYDCTTSPVDADGSGELWTVLQTVYGVADTPMAILADSHCAGFVRLPDYSRDIPDQFDTTNANLEYTVSATPPADTRIVLSGAVTDEKGDPLQYAYLTVGNTYASTDAQGRYSLRVEPGTYSIQAQFNGVYLQRPITIADTTTLDLRFPARPASVLVHVVDSDGQPVTGPPMVPGAERQKSFLTYNCATAPMDADGSGQPWTVTQAVYGIADTAMSVIGDAHCAGSIRLPDYSRDIPHEFDTTAEPLEYTVLATPPVDHRRVVSGVISDASGDPLQYAYITMGIASGLTDAEGRYSLQVEPGYHVVQAQFNGVYVQRPITMGDTAMQLDLRFPDRSASVLVHMVDADGQPVTGPPMVPGADRQKSFLNYYCQSMPVEADGSGQPWTVTQYASGIADTPMTIINDAHCAGSIRLPDYSRDISHEFNTTDQPLEYTVFRWGASIPGGDNDTNDGDNVADMVEALAPNNGDGNNDGTPDYEQQNVTSLPVNGGGLGDGANYVTVAAPEGTELTNVYTIDPMDTTRVETPPPPGVTLLKGLTNLVLKGLEDGSDQTLSIYTSSTQDVTGYAKYDPNTRQWSLLPDERVQIFDDRVEITLTDGGIGDDDGQANGRISDPGGIAIVRNLDSVAPTVTGHAASQPNANGWYNDDVTVQWTATDADPSSGIVAQPSDTVLDGEGGDLSADSVPVCDVAGNCSTGSVSGIKIDRTKPSVDVAGVEDGKTYTLGAVPTASCEATDTLSGVDGACEGTLSGGTANGVGDFVYAAKATDKAGNVRLVSVAYRVVYRFDGFQQPINDPVLVPGAARSVFKSGSTVPVKFQVKRADGTLIDPGMAPEWLMPEKGSPTGASVNEAVWSEPATSGTQFEKTGDQWHYNWKTKGVAAGYTYRIGVRLDDGTKHYVVVGAK